jgi:hypothetical protein
MKTRIAVIAVGVVEGVIGAIVGIAALEYQSIYALYLCTVWVSASAVTIRKSFSVEI